MNQAELHALQQPISHYARVLYCMYLQPHANVLSGASEPIKNKAIGKLLGDQYNTFTQGRQINSVIQELIDVGLVNINAKTDLSRSIQDQRVALPLMVLKDDAYQILHGAIAPMHGQWLPDETLYQELSSLVGLIDKSYTLEDVGEFVAYWLGRPQNRFTLFQWTQKFVLQRKQFAQRGNRQQAAQTVIGSQQVKTTAGIVADDKTRALVEKYNKPNNED